MFRVICLVVAGPSPNRNDEPITVQLKEKIKMVLFFTSNNELVLKKSNFDESCVPFLVVMQQ